MHRIFVPFCVCLVLALGVITTEAASEDVAVFKILFQWPANHLNFVDRRLGRDAGRDEAGGG